jgi:hypothetical protein
VYLVRRCVWMVQQGTENKLMSLLASRDCYRWQLQTLPEAEYVIMCVGRLACINREALHSRITFIKALSFCITAFITILASCPDNTHYT